VLILAVLGPLLTKESERIHDLLEKLFGRLKIETGRIYRVFQDFVN
jgi:hypothetical protein